MSAITVETVNSLATKIDSLDLADDERAALQSILERSAAGGAEVAGFSFEPVDVEAFGSPTALSFGTSLGMAGLPKGGVPPIQRFRC